MSDPALGLIRRIPVLDRIAEWTLAKRWRTWVSHCAIVCLLALGSFGAFALLRGWARWAAIIGFAVVAFYLVREAVASAREKERTVPKLVDHVFDALYAIAGLPLAAGMVAGNWPAVAVLCGALAVPVLLDVIDEDALNWVFRRIRGRS